MSKTFVASLSYGKDSMAMIHVIKDVLKLPLDRIITADVWATDTIPADLPPMVEFKAYADEEIKKRWGIAVEHFRAAKYGKPTCYEKEFYRVCAGKSKRAGDIWGFPMKGGTWCNTHLKMNAIKQAHKSINNCISYVGIAFDEPNRFHNLDELTVSPLVEAEWTEKMCRDWCDQNKLLSPIYTVIARGGCWFCHNQGINQLRTLRNGYPDLWALLLKWDTDSPVTFHADGKTVHDFDRRFRWEDEGYMPTEKMFRWADTENAQMNIYQFLGGD